MPISGQGEAIRLTHNGALQWGMVRRPHKWWLFAIYHPVRVSPDGRWVVVAPFHPVIVDTKAQQPPISLVASGGPGVVAWSPDSRSIAFGSLDLTTYDLLTGQSDTLVEGYGDIYNIVWSPDGRHIAFACCFEETPGTHVQTGEIQRVEVASGKIETAGTARSSFAGGVSQVCWTREGEAVNEDELEVTLGLACSYERYWYGKLSPDGTRRAVPTISSPDQAEADTLIIKDTRTDEVIWQRKLDVPFELIFWSPSGDYLLLDNNDLGTPIWRLKADGTGDAEVIVEDGLLLDVLPAYPQPP